MSLFAGRWQEVRGSFRRREETSHPPMLPSNSPSAAESASGAANTTGTSHVAAVPNGSPHSESEAAGAVSSPATGHKSAPGPEDDVTTLTVVTHNPPYDSTVPNKSSSATALTDSNSPRSAGAKSTAPGERGLETGISPAQAELSPSPVGPVSVLGRDLGPGTSPANPSFIQPGALSLSGNASLGPRTQTRGLPVSVSEEDENKPLSMGDSLGPDEFAQVLSLGAESAAPTEDLADRGNQAAMQEDSAANIV